MYIYIHMKPIYSHTPHSANQMCMVQCRFCLQKPTVFPQVFFIPGGVFVQVQILKQLRQLRYFCLKLQEIHVIHLSNHGISTDDGAFHPFPWPKSICLILPGCKRLKFLLQLVGKKTWANKIQMGWHLIHTKAMKNHLSALSKSTLPLYKVYLSKRYAKNMFIHPKSCATIYLFLVQHRFWPHLCGDGHPTFNRNPYNGYINPYYWGDDYPPIIWQ